MPRHRTNVTMLYPDEPPVHVNPLLIHPFVSHHPFPRSVFYIVQGAVTISLMRKIIQKQSTINHLPSPFRRISKTSHLLYSLFPIQTLPPQRHVQSWGH